MRTEENKRKAAEEEKESMLRKTVRCLKALDRADKAQEVVEVTKVEVTEEEEQWMTEEEEEEEEETNYMIKTLGMFEFGS